MRNVHRVFVGFSIALLMMDVLASFAFAQIQVIGGDEPNYFTSSTPDLPTLADIGSARDVFISDDLEVGGRLYVDGILHVNRIPEDTDQFIYFSDDGSNSNESIGWDESADAFSMTNDLDLFEGANNTVTIRARAENELQLFAEAPEMFFLIDSNSNDNANIVDHTFTWSNNSTSNNQRAMVLRSVTGSVGDLELNGTLTENVAFDLAESFFMTEAVKATQLVAVDPLRPDAVVPADRWSRDRVLGVVSTRPGILMGGGAFSVEGLREAWGEQTTELFRQERADLELEVLAANEALRELAFNVESAGAFEAMFRASSEDLAAAEALRAASDDDSDGPVPSSLVTESQIRSAYEAALRSFETRLIDAVMKRFFQRHFAPVALAGRVPVAVDAGYGPIRPGDPLTVSETPGVARRAATAGAIVGTALEGLDRGRGTILMLVHRGSITGPGADQAAKLDALEDENRQLGLRLAKLEKALEELSPEPQRLAARRSGIR